MRKSLALVLAFALTASATLSLGSPFSFAEDVDPVAETTSTTGDAAPAQTEVGIVNENFSDVPFADENAEAIEYLKDEKIVNGYADGSFKPDDKINRVEFTKIVIGAKFQQSEIDSCISANVEAKATTVFFPDVPRDAWYAPYICLAKAKGIVGGYPDGNFKPEGNISFIEEAKIIVNTFGFEVETGASWYEGFVKKMDELNAIPKTVETLTEQVDRGEMAESIYRIDAKEEKKLSPSFEELKTWTETDSVSGANLTKLNLAGDVNNVWFTDGASVYYKMGEGKQGAEFKKLFGADPQTFKIMGSDYESDANNVYYLYIKVDNVKPSNFRILRNSYATDGANIYFLGSVIASGPEAASFQILDDITATSNQHVFYEGREIAGADPVAFKLAPGANDPSPTWSFCGKDTKHVYCEGLRFAGVDAGTFSYLTFGIAQDKNGAYCGNGRLDVDAATLKIVDNANQYIKDSKNVYSMNWEPSRAGCNIKKVSGADPATFN